MWISSYGYERSYGKTRKLEGKKRAGPQWGLAWIRMIRIEESTRHSLSLVWWFHEFKSSKFPHSREMKYIGSLLERRSREDQEKQLVYNIRSATREEKRCFFSWGPETTRWFSSALILTTGCYSILLQRALQSHSYSDRSVPSCWKSSVPRFGWNSAGVWKIPFSFCTVIS